MPEVVAPARSRGFDGIRRTACGPIGIDAGFDRQKKGGAALAIKGIHGSATLE